MRQFEPGTDPFARRTIRPARLGRCQGGKRNGKRFAGVTLYSFLRTPRTALLGIVLLALGACRLDISPEEFDLTADVGDTVQETLTLSNPSDDPVDYTLTPVGADISLSSESGRIEAGEQTEVEVSMTCDDAGPVSGSIRVRAATGNKSTIVEVPVALQCGAAEPVEVVAGLVSIEIFQGPPVYKKDFETGEEFGHVPMTRPEDGSRAKDPIPWNLSYAEELRRMHNVWSPDDEGFVTGVWRKRAAAAVAVRHSDDAHVPAVFAAIDLDGKRADLPETYRETHRTGEGFITDIVFEVERALFARGATLHVSVDSGDEQVTERVPLFGEEVPVLEVTWVPIILEEVPNEEPIDPEERMTKGVLPWWPIGDYKTGMGPTMTYEQRDQDRQDGAPAIHHEEAARQLVDHRLLHACGAQEIYYGVASASAIEAAGLAAPNWAISGFQQWVVFDPGDHIPEASARDARLRRASHSSVTAHEMGHMFGIGHAPCNVGVSEHDRYPYEDATLGPARQWDFFDNRFAGRSGMRGVEVLPIYLQSPGYEYVDLMSYCGPPDMVSDYNYQRAFVLRQSDDYWEAFDTAPADDCTPAAADKAVEGLVKKSGKAPEAPMSIAISGSVDAHGVAAVRMAQPTSKPPWLAPKTGDMVIVILDAGGLELHRQPVRTSPLSHSDGRMAWSARVPYFDGAATVVLRTPQGDLRAAGEILTAK